jgi:hypothetical protein
VCSDSGAIDKTGSSRLLLKASEIRYCIFFENKPAGSFNGAMFVNCLLIKREAHALMLCDDRPNPNLRVFPIIRYPVKNR